MSNFLGTLWAVAGYLAAGCVIVLLALIFAGFVTAFIKHIKGGAGK